MRDPTVVAVIQARMGSTRLPGKVLLRMAGDTVLGHVVRRALSVRGVDKVVVATTMLPEDDCLVRVAQEHGAAVTRGPDEDVLARYVLAFAEHGGEVGVRVTADCPCLDPRLVAQGLEHFKETTPRLDYLSNTVQRSFPRGYDFEVFRIASLLVAAAEARDSYSREHVTPFLYRHPERFRIKGLRRDDPKHSADWRLTLDTADDGRLLQHLFEALGPINPTFGVADVERYLTANPGVLALNRHVLQEP